MESRKGFSATCLLIVIGVAIVAFGAGYIIKTNAQPGILSGQGHAPQGGPSPFQTSVGTKLADAPFAKNAFLISTSTLSAEAQKALNGFTVSSTTQPDGSVTYTLKATNPAYQTQTYTLTSGEQLYFVEMFLADDQGGTDRNVQDDHAVVVDANGVIVQ